MSPVVYGAILPHPPVLVPEVGRERAQRITQSKKAVVEVVRRLAVSNPDTMIILTPHGEVGFSTLHVSMGHVYEGPFGVGYLVASFDVKINP